MFQPMTGFILTVGVETFDLCEPCGEAIPDPGEAIDVSHNQEPRECSRCGEMFALPEPVRFFHDAYGPDEPDDTFDEDGWKVAQNRYDRYITGR